MCLAKEEEDLLALDQSRIDCTYSLPPINVLRPAKHGDLLVCGKKKVASKKQLGLFLPVVLKDVEPIGAECRKYWEKKNWTFFYPDSLFDIVKSGILRYKLVL